jgi:hypothetical protein
MALTVRKGKVNRHEKITQVMLSGKPVTPAEIQSVFAGTDQEKVLYRLSTNIYNIRKDGGVVKVIKNGRKVEAYQLVNYDQFDASGRFKGAVKTAPKPAPVVSKQSEPVRVQTATASA